MLEIGKYHNLQVIKKLDFGVYLQGEENEEILLPRAYITDELKIDDYIEVFIYRDSEDRVIATTLKPFAIVNDFAYLQVKSVNKTGAFLDWGLPKDLMVPFREQKEKMIEGKYYLVKIYLDSITDRIVASANIRRFLGGDISVLHEGQKVDIIIYDKTELGYNVIINSEFLGLVYKMKYSKEFPQVKKLLDMLKSSEKTGKLI